MNLCIAIVVALGLTVGQAPATGVTHRGIVPGHKISGDPVVYPAKAKRKHISGLVHLKFKIAEDGTVEGVTVIDGPELLRQAAIDSVLTWVYTPYTLDGKPIEVDSSTVINFNLGNN